MKRILFSFWLTVLCGLFPINGWTAPTISLAPPSVSHGQSIAITGLGFGTKSPAQPYLWAPFEGSINPSSLGTKTSWDVNESMAYNSSEGAGGKGCAKATDNSGTWTLGVNTNGVIGWNDFSQKMYLFRKVKINFPIDNKNWKSWRLWANNYTYPNIYIQLGSSMNLMNQESNSSCGYLQNGDAARNNQLNNFASEELIMRANSGAGVEDSSFVYTSNGTTVTNDTSCDLDRALAQMVLIFPAHGVIANATMGSSDRTWYDDIYLDNTWARVMIADASTWAASTHKEPQIPSAWSVSNITVTVNSGTFTTGQQAYLYVVDSTGAVNSNGYPITIGSSGGGSGDTTPPTNVAITAPLSGATVSGNTAVTATASDNVGVAKVEFYMDSTSSAAIGTVTASPYSYTWNTSSVTNGSHTLYAKASDAANNSTISTGIVVTVSNTVVDTTPPTVSISSPASNATLTGNTIVTAAASDNIGVAKVDFYLDSINSTAVASVTSAPYSFTWDPSTVANGPHTLYARASDVAGNTSQTSVIVTVSVSSSSSGTVARNECASPPQGTVFCEDFEGTNPKADFDDYDGNPDTENLIVTDSGPAGNSSNKAIRLFVPAGQSGGSDLVKVLATSYDKLYARWYFKYEPGFNFSALNHGGGLEAGDRNYIGQSGNRPTGSDFAGFYLQYQENAPNPYAYSYYRGMYQDCSNPNGSCWGDSFPCVFDSGATFCTKPQDRPTVTLPTLVAGQWYCYEQMVDMGNPSTDGSGATGRITQWLNGNLIGDNTNLWLRTTASLKLQNLWLSLYHPDGTHSVAGELIDNVVISTQRIGCGGSGTVPNVANLRTLQIIP